MSPVGCICGCGSSVGVVLSSLMLAVVGTSCTFGGSSLGVWSQRCDKGVDLKKSGLR